MNLWLVKIVHDMTILDLTAARAKLALMPDQPGRDLAIEVIDTELLARDVSRYNRERYVGKFAKE